jgi:hypothetical protein
MTGCPVWFEDPNPSPAPTPGTWTIMVYLDADNNLEPYGIEDFNEMEGVDLENSGINVVVLMDRIPGYDSSNGNWTDTRVFHVEYDPLGPDNTDIVSPEVFCPNLYLRPGFYHELNMGDPAVCSAFIDFCKIYYPADNYFLILWDHGDGWMKKSISGSSSYTTKGVCYDESTSGYDRLYTKELGDAVRDKGLTVIGFDACFEGMLEVAYEIRNDASYMIASEETEDADGWEYDDWLSTFASSGQSAEDLYTEVITAYFNRYKDVTGATLSAVDLSQIDALMTEMNNFSDAVYSAITNSTIQSQVQDTLLTKVEKFWDYYSGYGDVNLDIYDLAYVIKNDYDIADSEADDLMTAVTNVVVDEWHNTTDTGDDGNPNANGIAIHCCPIEAYFVTYISPAYLNGYNWDYNLEFVEDSTWVPSNSGGYPTGPGLLYRVWYESF